jgi:hypothetical protein
VRAGRGRRRGELNAVDFGGAFRAAFEPFVERGMALLVVHPGVVVLAA